MHKILIVGGPTATGKTEFALNIAKRFSGELVSADSRQIYKGMDIITGKDIPDNFTLQSSNLRWRNRDIQYYADSATRLWLTDIVYPNEAFNVSFWNDCARVVIEDIVSRGKLPIIVGVTGLYIKSLLQAITTIHVPANPQLRLALEKLSREDLLKQLQRVDPDKADSLNESDRLNPRRLIRAIEVASSEESFAEENQQAGNYLSVILSGPNDQMYSRIDSRVHKRIAQGAEDEVKKMLELGYNWDLPSMQTSGYMLWKEYLEGTSTKGDLIQKWQWAEHRDFRRQLTWFKKLFPKTWFDTTKSEWKLEAEKLVSEWYNNADATQG